MLSWKACLKNKIGDSFPSDGADLRFHPAPTGYVGPVFIWRQCELAPRLACNQRGGRDAKQCRKKHTIPTTTSGGTERRTQKRSKANTRENTYQVNATVRNTPIPLGGGEGWEGDRGEGPGG